jgi:hypothetical protein
MSSNYISFVNYLDAMGSLLISVHKLVRILAMNKKYANFSSKDGMEMEHHLFYILYLFNFKLS